MNTFALLPSSHKIFFDPFYHLRILESSLLNAFYQCLITLLYLPWKKTSQNNVHDHIYFFHSYITVIASSHPAINEWTLLLFCFQWHGRDMSPYCLGLIWTKISLKGSKRKSL